MCPNIGGPSAQCPVLRVEKSRKSVARSARLGEGASCEGRVAVGVVRESGRVRGWPIGGRCAHYEVP
eukprot:scaffold247714_cov30-Tisochrysis_lutea.AAC.1